MYDASKDLTTPSTDCVLCRLATERPNVAYVAHELYRRGLNSQEVAQRMHSVFAEAKLEALRAPVFSRHFGEHCDILQSAADIWRDNDHDTDYFELRALYRQLRDVSTDVAEELLQNDGPVSAYRPLIALTKELRQMLKTLADMRNSEKLVSHILTRHTQQLVRALTTPLGATLRDLRDKLQRGEDPETVATDLDRMLCSDLFPLFEAAGRQALEQSRQQYKLH